MLKRIVLCTFAAIIIFFAGRWVGRMLSPDETKIARAVNAMIAGFNDTRMNPILEGLDVNFLDENYGVDRELVRTACASLFFTAKDETTKKFLYVAEATTSDIVVTKPDDGPRTATANVDVAFSRRKGEELEPAWSVRVKARLQKRDGDWVFFRTETSTVSGQQLR